jgi:glucose-6-phosphate 1-dehydrogenase
MLENTELQILFSVNPDDIRSEKVKVLKSCREVQLEDLVLGQYIADPNGTTEDAKMVKIVN